MPAYDQPGSVPAFGYEEPPSTSPALGPRGSAGHDLLTEPVPQETAYAEEGRADLLRDAVRQERVREQAQREGAVQEEPVREEGPPRRPTAHRRDLWRGLSRRDRIMVVGGGQLRLLVLACTREDTTAVDLASGALVRLRVPWPTDHDPDLTAFDVVEATVANDPERDDLAQPEALSAAGLPRHIGTLRGRKVRRMLMRLAAPPGGPLLGFAGTSAPYWDFRGSRPSVALVVPTRGPQLIRRREDGSTWARFGWERDDVWLPVLDLAASRALDAARRDRLSGKSLASALGYRPHYLLASLSRPREGHCYKVITALLPRS